MRKLWRGIINFFVEALGEDTKTVVQRKREAQRRQQRSLQNLNRR
jgi:hypothetical protein